jgi:hypothetical protein
MFYPNSDLDVYTHPGFAREVGLWLIHGENYTFKPNKPQHGTSFNNVRVNGWTPWNEAFNNGMTYSDEIFDDYDQNRINDIYYFEKDGPNGSHLRIQIISSEFSPMLCILSFHSSTLVMWFFSSNLDVIDMPSACVMNFIAFDAAYSLYSCATFEKHLNLIFHDKSEADKCIAKYALRGWLAIANVWPQRHGLEKLFLLNQDRSVTDSHCWVVPLDLTGVRR